MRSYSDFSVRELMDALASPTPAPGGGSAAALAGATGTALLLMALGVRAARETTPPELAGASDRLASVAALTRSLIDRDARAYASVVAALRLPEASDPEGRRTALQAALRSATEVPLEIMRACREALRAAPSVADHCTIRTTADVGVAVELLTAAVRGASLTVDANINTLTDTEYAAGVTAERDRLRAESTADANDALSRLSYRTGG